MTGAILAFEDWTEWVTEPSYETPEFPSARATAAMDEAARDEVLLQRVMHNAREVTVLNQPVRDVHAQVKRRHLLNQASDPKARTGFVLAGPPRTGKSTMLLTFGKAYELDLRSKFPDRFIDTGGARYTPVVYFSLPQAATEKTISKGLAEYLNVPYMRSENEQDITRKVLRALKEMRTEFLLIDEIHNLGRHGSGPAGNRLGRIANDYLKSLCNHCGATPFFAGVDVEKSGLFSEFSGGRVTQTSGRFTVLPADPYGCKTADEAKRWRELILAMERPLSLHRHERGDLVKLSAYLHIRTGGYVATLSQLIREAAVLAIETGTERVDKELLDAVLVDKQSADQYAETLKKVSQGVAKQATARKRHVS